MTRPRLLFYIQHLLGIGHLVRGARIAAACAGALFDVTVVLGGERPAGIDFGAATVTTLPPIKAGPGGFSDLVGADGRPVDETFRALRRDALLALFERVDPDILLIEAFPFGRRAMRFELIPLLDVARARPRPLLIATSVRDILQDHPTPGRDRETVETVRRYFDLVLVHGDPTLARLDDSFPLAAAVADRIAYGGLVGPATDGVSAEVFDVIVSVGGGAVGADLIATAVEARRKSRLAAASWLVLTGPNAPPHTKAPAESGVTFRAFVPDLPQRLRRARLSISQAGYNTVADLLTAPACRAVLVPYVGDGETEQTRRAALFDAAGLGVSVEAVTLTPERLAAAIDHALAQPPRVTPFTLDGAARGGAILRDRWRERAARLA